MQKDTIERLTDHDISRLANLMADNPEFAKKLVDAISQKLDEKFGFHIGRMKDHLEQHDDQFKKINSKLDRMEGKIDTLSFNFKMMGERHELLERKVDRGFEKVSQSLERLESSSDEPAATGAGRLLQR